MLLAELCNAYYFMQASVFFNVVPSADRHLLRDNSDMT
jgi:hypothetical protein